MPERLFVYGTLQRGSVNHPLLAGARRLGPARTAPGFALVDLGPYPGMVRRGPAAVAGELYRATPAVLDALDRFEGHPWLFRRVRVPLADGRPAFAYLLAPGQAAGRSLLAPDGDGTVRWTADGGAAAGSAED
jgi:gamma-glutamylcyclotransferase (GGCT)/AIG2-like uncharacterized protein YtfP